MSIDLAKGQRISLEKEGGGALDYIEIGVNWGAIEKKGFFGGKKNVAVDLDASVGMFNAEGNLVDAVWYGQLKSKCRSILHSGDDRVGDTGGDDGEDNEVVQISLNKVPKNVTTLALVLNSYSQQNFGVIPFAGIRIHNGKAGTGSVFATFDVANDPTFSGKVSMIMGSVYRHDNSWKFRSIGAAITEKDLKESLTAFSRDYTN
ncbi:TerD family protein [Marinobacter sp.]|uniref:TerD family protein n=1 Tax=Marinobacter sp. TaxID=50741 RepID=UPI001B43A587|nr:TerD family protein [Marinobacter sp.]MBQ0832397.1 TerD family protein [Marinobacter sp.]